MPRDGWFRRTSWTDDDRAEFLKRLGRSRGGFHKAQYLRIQALHLSEAGEIEGAIELLKLLLSEFPERSQLALAHVQMGDCLLALGQVHAALDEYRAALDAEKRMPNVHTPVWLKFPWVVATRGMRNLYSEARDFLEWGGRQATFPVEEYMLSTVEALMADDEGCAEVAERFARLAVAAANKRHSGIRYHPNVGLVEREEPAVKRRLENLTK